MIETLGVDRDDYTIPEYKDAMRKKDETELENATNMISRLTNEKKEGFEMDKSIWLCSCQHQGTK